MITIKLFLIVSLLNNYQYSTILRDGKRQKLDVVIGQLPEGDLTVSAPVPLMDRLGISVQTLAPELAEQFGISKETGVVVTQVKPGSVAAMAGIQPGTIIQEVNRKQIKNTEDFVCAADEASKQDSILLLIKEGQYSRYVILRIEK